MRQEYLFRAMEPISQGMETCSNIQLINVRKIIQSNGLWESVPVVTSNAMCNRLVRSPGARKMAEICEIKDLEKEALQWLFNGGNLTPGGASIKIDDIQAARALIPLFALTGGAFTNQLISGKLQISDNVLICKETLHVVGDVPKDIEYMHSHDYIQINTFVNADPSSDPVSSQLLTEQIKQQTKEERGKSTIMPYERSSVAAGSLWYWSISSAYELTDLEIGALNCSLNLWDGKVGGRVNRGFGRLQTLTPFSSDHVEEYEQHLRDHAQEIRDYMHSEMMKG